MLKTLGLTEGGWDGMSDGDDDEDVEFEGDDEEEDEDEVSAGSEALAKLLDKVGKKPVSTQASVFKSLASELGEEMVNLSQGDKKLREFIKRFRKDYNLLG